MEVNWGMNLQDESYHQKELKDTISEISSDVAKVKFTLTTEEPVGVAGEGLKTAIKLGWPAIVADTNLSTDEYEVYPAIEEIAADKIIAERTLSRTGDSVDY